MSIKLQDGGPLKPTNNWPTSRSKLVWPFDAESYMNKSIGEDAVFIDLQNQPLNRYEVNYEHAVNPANDDPFIPYYCCDDGNNPCGVEATRCVGTTPVRSDGTPTNVQFPVNYIVPNTGFIYTDNTGCADGSNDNPMSWLVPGQNNDYMYQGGLMARCVAGGPIYGPQGNYATNLTFIKGSGYEAFGGRYGGSGICMRGLAIKPEDITSDNPIPHAGAIWCQPELFWWDRTDILSRPFRWPARRTDARPEEWVDLLQPHPLWDPTALVSNTIPGFTMGALVAIPMSITAASIGIQTEPGLKFFNMFQDYGAYFVNTAGFNREYHRISQAWTPEAISAFETRYGFVPSIFSDLASNCLYAVPDSPKGRWFSDFNAIWTNLHLVDDNSATNIGGAGDRRIRPPAPPFSD